MVTSTPQNPKWLFLTTHLIIDFEFSLQAIDYLDKLLRYDHQTRLTAKEAMVILFIHY